MRVNKAEKNRKRSAVFHIFAVMLLATMLSCRAVSSTMARYISSESKTDSARVAKFSVTANGETASGLSLKYGESAGYTLTVNNASEVDVSFTVSLIFRDCDVSNQLQIALNKNATDDQPAGSAVTKTGVYDTAAGHTVFTFTGSDYYLHVGESADYTITVTALNGFLPGVNSRVESQTASFGFETQVEFVQVD